MDRVGRLDRCWLALVLASSLGLAACGQPPAPSNAGVVAADAVVLLTFADTPPDALATGAICSGALVGANVLTAAHCLGDEALDAVVGVADMCDPGSVEVVRLGDPIPLPADEGSLDLALLPLTQALSGTAPRPRPADPNGLVAVGFGGTGPTGVRSCAQHRVTLQALDPGACSHLLAAAGSAAPDPGDVLCASGQGDGTCSGDSGGPVLDDRGWIVAVTSYGRDCAAGTPGVYPRLAGLEEWLTGS